MHSLIYPFNTKGFILRELKISYTKTIFDGIASKTIFIDRKRHSKIKLNKYIPQDLMFNSINDILSCLKNVFVPKRSDNDDHYYQYFYPTRSDASGNDIEYHNLLDKILKTNHGAPYSEKMSGIPSYNHGFINTTFYKYFISPLTISNTETKRKKPILYNYCVIYSQGNKLNTIIEFKVEIQPLEVLWELNKKAGIQQWQVESLLIELDNVSKQAYDDLKEEIKQIIATHEVKICI